MARVVILAEVVEVTLLDLEAGGRDTGASAQPLAVFTKGGPEVQLEPGLGKLDPLLPVALDQGDRRPVDLGGVARLKGVQKCLGRVYCLGNSRSMSARWMIPSLRSRASAFPPAWAWRRPGRWREPVSSARWITAAMSWAHSELVFGVRIWGRGWLNRGFAMRVHWANGG